MKKTIALLLLISVVGFRQPSQPSAQQTPNVILIFMDDMGYGDLSCYGALDYHTPNLDRLAAEGMRFTNFLSAQAVCSASRAALLTGCYPNRIGISGALFPNSKVGLSKDETTIAEMLKSKGYRTGIFGKWHLGDDKSMLPLNHGFDEYLGIPYSNDMWPFDYAGMPAKPNTNKAQFPPLPLIRNDKHVDTISSLEDQGLLTQRLTDEAIKFIKKNKSQKFFAYIPHPMPHVPIYASPSFKGKSKQGMYGDVIQEVDHNVGRIMQTLKEEGLEKNTIVIFTSDNGPWYNFGNHAGSNGGFREGKGTSFEGGQRVPCIMRWKGNIPSGMVSNQLSSSIDILPTLAKLTNADLPQKKIDGVELTEVLKGNTKANPRETFYYYYRRNALEAVRKGNWKLVLEHPSRSYLNQKPGVDGYPGSAPENVLMFESLYDLRRDPGEQHDVKRQNPQILIELRALAEEARKDLGDDLRNRKGANTREPGRLAIE